MLKYLFIAVAGLMLAACNPEAGDQNVRNLLASACPAAEQAYEYYAAIAVSGAISQRSMDRVEQAKAYSDSLCANRETATVASVLHAGALIYASTRTAIDEAKARGVDVGYAGDLRRLDGAMGKLKRELDRAR